MTDPLTRVRAALARLEKASEGATRERWVYRYHQGDDDGPHAVSTAHGKANIAKRRYFVASCPEADARHIAAHSPPVAAALRACAEALVEETVLLQSHPDRGRWQRANAALLALVDAVGGGAGMTRNATDNRSAGRKPVKSPSRGGEPKAKANRSVEETSDATHISTRRAALLALAERVEKAEGPDAGLYMEARDLVWPLPITRWHNQGEISARNFIKRAVELAAWESVALAFRPPGWRLLQLIEREDGTAVAITENRRNKIGRDLVQSGARTLGNALLAAMLRAQAEEG